MKKLTTFLILLIILKLNAQTGNIQFEVIDSENFQTIDTVDVRIIQTDETFDFKDGNIVIENLPSGVYSFEISSPNYENYTLFETLINPGTNNVSEIYLNPINQLEEVTIKASSFSKTSESPTSFRTMTSEEITRSAGGNRDISKVVQSLPGVTSTASFRNDLLIRGGGPNENRFYIDDIETPIINHFATQGASGGPRGMINVNFLKEVEFYSSAFPANRGNALSSVFEFKMKTPNKDPFHMRSVIGLDDMSFSAEGTLGKKEDFTYLLSVNRSNLQLLFKAFKLPFLPSYTDMNMKFEKKFANGDKLYFASIWAIDRFKLNFDIEKTDQNIAILDQIPVAPQDNYTIGLAYLKKANNGNWTFVASRNFLHNTAIKYQNNIELPENLLLNYRSNEADNRIRVERKFKWNTTQVNLGAGYNATHYYNNTYNKFIVQDQVVLSNYNTSIDFNSYHAFALFQNSFFNNRLKWSLGARIDGSDYNGEMNKPLEQFSPRLGLTYQIIPRTFINFSAGIFYQLPYYTAMGYKVDNQLVNKQTLDYIRNSHLVFGLEYNTPKQMKITLEGFYKKYKHYPFSLEKNINLANLGGDFGVVGVEPVVSNGFGRAYGLEFLVQQRTSRDIYGILAYTLSWSEFNNPEEKYIPSAWDARQILSLTTGKVFKKNWDVGFRFRLQTGLPETPYDLYNSSFVDIWNVNNGPLTDYTLLNTERGVLANQLDIRVQKKWFFKKWSLAFYVDFINVYGGSLGNNLPVVYLERDDNENPIIENPDAPANEQRYQLKTGAPDKPTPIPYTGLIIEF